MEIEYFGVERRLLGSVHRPGRLRPRSTAVLLCNPFGEEASRAHRTYRVLATQLAAAGYAALRFDYSGTGDSDGTSSDATVDRWLGDVAAAAEQLLATSRAQRVALVGLRFGATLALLAASRHRPLPHHVILWDPIVDGASYVRELAAQHRHYMHFELGSAWRDRLQVRRDGSPTEALGMPIDDALAAGIAAIDLASVVVRAREVTIITTRPITGGDRLRVMLPSARWTELVETVAWNSDAALNAMVVPADIVRAIVSRIEESCP